jgi:hypothetical protein
MTFTVRVRRAITILMIQLWAAGCSDEPPAPNVDFLASDAHFLVASYHIVVPIVALRGPGEVFTIGDKLVSDSETLKTKAADPNNPMPVDSIALGIYEYKYVRERNESVKICPLLKRHWAQRVCRGDYNVALKLLPETFDLIDRNKVERLKNRGTAGGENQYDQVKDMSLRLGVAEIGCDKASKFCTSAVATLPNLIAVWTVWSDENTGESASQMSNRQGAALTEFVRRAIGPIEDDTFALAD